MASKLDRRIDALAFKLRQLKAQQQRSAARRRALSRAVVGVTTLGEQSWGAKP
jgi:hypothetical protein